MGSIPTLAESEKVFCLCTYQVLQRRALRGFCERAVTLFSGDSFKEVMSLSPSVVPVPKEFLTIDSKHLEGIIFIVTPEPMADLCAHLRSLLFAGLDGEEIHFRFYDSKVIVPMLNAMHQSERERFLGPAKHWLVINPQETHVWEQSKHHNFQPESKPWWRIEPHHLEPLYTPKIHAISIERKLWHKLPNLMDHPEINRGILENILTTAQAEKVSPEAAELRVLQHIIQITHFPIDALSKALLLTSDERESLELTIKGGVFSS